MITVTTFQADIKRMLGDADQFRGVTKLIRLGKNGRVTP
jgi:hypothetical protein